MASIFSNIFKTNKFKDLDSTLSNNLKYYVLNGLLYTIVMNLYKPFAQKFLFRLDGTEFHVSLFNALPGLIAIFAVLPGIMLMSRYTRKKNIMAVSFFMSRIFILSFAFIPMLPIQYQPMAFVLLSSFMNFPDSVSQTALQSFSADIFPEDRRALAITSKNKFSAFINFTSLILLGQIIGLFGKTPAKTIEVYQILFVIAFVISIFEIASLRKIKETRTIAGERIDIRNVLKEVFANKTFMKFMICSLLFHFGWQMGWPLFSIYQIKYLGADEVWLTILGVSSGIVMFFSYSKWEKIICRKGNQYAIALATAGMAATPILYALSPNLIVLMLSGLIMGFFTSGTITTILNSLLEAAPTKNRLIYVGVHSTLTNMTLFIAPLFGDFTLRHTNIYIALCICAVLRFVGSFAFFRREKHSKCRAVGIEGEIS